jgi:hypothetical protein
MFNFNVNTHTAVKICMTKADYYTCLDRAYSTKAGLEACPEYQAYTKCFNAYLETLGVVSEATSNSLKQEVNAWKKSAIAQMAHISTIEWRLSDTSAYINPFNKFEGEKVSIRVDRTLDETRVTVENEYGHTYSFFVCEDKTNDVKYDLGMVILEDEKGNKGYFVFAE